MNKEVVIVQDKDGWTALYVDGKAVVNDYTSSMAPEILLTVLGIKYDQITADEQISQLGRAPDNLVDVVPDP